MIVTVACGGRGMGRVCANQECEGGKENLAHETVLKKSFGSKNPARLSIREVSGCKFK
ncbi:hypothetical protein [Brucella intermedia]|uniref:hypothetical protein n=1 Tax=Brucella intermedia TaxID=94625 RepID=UPI001FCEA6A9|nr:hypothetical protein [Brucella intermedia]